MSCASMMGTLSWAGREAPRSHAVRSADVVSRAGDGAVVRVGVVTGEHRRVRADDGTLVSDQPAGDLRVSVLTLQRIDGRWRVSQRRETLDDLLAGDLDVALAGAMAPGGSEEVLPWQRAIARRS